MLGGGRNASKVRRITNDAASSAPSRQPANGKPSNDKKAGAISDLDYFKNRPVIVQIKLNDKGKRGAINGS
jgi:hypothetical protein